MKKVPIVILLAALSVSCELTNSVPSITSQMAAGKNGQHVGLATLCEGRALFAGRCIECHTLPPLARYSTDDWPEIIDRMARRSSLKPAERDAIVAYVTTVRSQR